VSLDSRERIGRVPDALRVDPARLGRAGGASPGAQPTTHISTTRLRTLDPSLRPSTKHELSHVLQVYTRR